MTRLRLGVFIFVVVALAASLAPVLALDPSKPQAAPVGENTGLESVTGLAADVRAKIAPELLKELVGAEGDGNERSQDATVSYLVYMRDKLSFDEPTVKLATARRESLVSALQNAADESQAAITSYLATERAAGAVRLYQSFWIFDGLLVESNLSVALALAARDDVAYLRPNRVHQLEDPRGESPASLLTEGPEWGLVQMGADRVWSELGVTGEGVVVANVDSGVDWTHPALQSHYRGYDAAHPQASIHDYNWYDPTGTYPTSPGPLQANISIYSDHGTHVMGSMLGVEANGSNPIGVAPGAQWISVKAFDDYGNASDANIHAALQWCLAPTDLEGANPDPSKAPDVVNNSWGDDNGLDETFRQDAEALNAAGIITIWSAGNEGPGTGTVGSPASYGSSFSVGATNNMDALASFSSRGPSPWGQIKPEVSAPGVNIRSSIAGGTYEGGWNGTSMAAPHTAGLAALILDGYSRAQTVGSALSVVQVRYLITSTVTDLGTTGQDNQFGWGRIDAFQAVSAVLQGGTFAGRVTDRQTGEPLVGALIAMRNRATGGQAHTLTGELGEYAFSVAKGSYDVQVQKFGYLDAHAYAINILEGTTTQLDFALTGQPTGVLTGRVTRARDAAPVMASIDVLGTPVTAEADAQGDYALTLPAGMYDVRFLSQELGTRGLLVEQVVISEGLMTRLDAQLIAAPTILLVDADPSETDVTQPYYRDAFDDLLYAYDLVSISDSPVVPPSASELSAYDLVVWAHASSSPDSVSAWGSLGAYLDGGGRLLLSGQDIGFWDDRPDAARDAYRGYLHVSLSADDGGFLPLRGVPGSILDGLQLEFNTDDSARNQAEPDVLAFTDGIAEPILATPAGGLAGVTVSGCGYRVAYLPFGVEGVGPSAARNDLLQRLVDWTVEDAPEHDLSLRFVDDAIAAEAGATIALPIWLGNRGQAGAWDLRVSSSAADWGVEVVSAETGVRVANTGELQSCDSLGLVVTVSVPQLAVADESVVITLTADSATSGSVVAQTTIRISQPWQSVASLPTPRYRLSAAALDCNIYVIGGYLDDGDDPATGLVEIFDLETQSWHTGASKPTIAANSGLAVLGNLIYVLGGWDPDTIDNHTAAVEIYDPTTDSWSVGVPMPEPISGLAAVGYRGRIYAFGGNLTDGSPSTTTWVLDPGLGVWEARSFAPVADLDFASAVVVDDMIYVAGGWSERSNLWRYDPQADTWQALTPMGEGRNAFAMVAVDEMIYVAGGGSGWTGLGSAARYDTATDTWEQLLPLTNSHRAGAAGVYVDGRFYVLGGADAGSVSSVEALAIRVPLAASLEATPMVSRAGQVIRYTLTVRNPQEELATASWVHRLPTELDFVLDSAQGGAIYDASERVLSWQGDLELKGTRVFVFDARARSDLAGLSQVVSSVQVDTGGCGPLVADVTVAVHVPSLSLSTLQVDKLIARPGERLHYTLTLANESVFTIPVATFYDPIPAHTTLVQGSVAGGASYNGEQNRIEWAGEFPAGETAPTIFAWRDAGGGLELYLGDDDCEGPLPLGFDFEFYGETYADVYVGSNGMVLFESCSTALSNTAIPREATPNAFVAPFWDDLVPATGHVFLDIQGTAPRRCAVIEYRDVRSYGTEFLHTFEVLLYEGTNVVALQYLSVEGSSGSGASATVGIENADGSEGVQYLYNGAPAEHLLHNRLVVALEHSSTRDVTRRQFFFDVQVDSQVPPLTTITNIATLVDELATHQREVHTELLGADLSESEFSVSPGQLTSGDLATYQIHIFNTGAMSATEVALVNVLPAGLTLVPDSLSGVGATYDDVHRRIAWQGSLEPGVSLDVSYMVRANEGLPVNSVQTSVATLAERGVIMADMETELLVNPVDLDASTKTASPRSLAAGEQVDFTITVHNSGLVTCDSVSVVDPLPDGLVLVSETLEGGFYRAESGTIEWQGAVPAGDQHIVRYAAQVGSNVANGMVITNVATIRYVGGTDLHRSASISVVRGDLSGSELRVAPTLVTPGRVVTYTLQVRNSGAVGIWGDLHFQLPTALLALPESVFASSGTASWDGELAWQGMLAAHSLVVVRVEARVPQDALAASLLAEAFLVDSGGIEIPLSTWLVVSRDGLTYQSWPLIYNQH